MCGPSLKSSKATPQKNDKRSVRTRTAKRIFFCPAAAAERDRAALRERSRSTNSTNDQLRTKEPRKVSSEVRGVAGIVGSPQAQAYAADRVRCERYIRGKALVARATNALLSIDIHPQTRWAQATKLRNAINSKLSTIRREQLLLDALGADGWQGSRCVCTSPAREGERRDRCCWCVLTAWSRWRERCACAAVRDMFPPRRSSAPRRPSSPPRYAPHELMGFAQRTQ
jgi:hypothetical protein